MKWGIGWNYQNISVEFTEMVAIGKSIIINEDFNQVIKNEYTFLKKLIHFSCKSVKAVPINRLAEVTLENIRMTFSRRSIS